MDRILIIDDDQQLGASFAKILVQEGYQVGNAFTGREGIDKAVSFQPHLVILDIRLPDMNGIEVFSVIHEVQPKLPVIIITAYGTTDTAIGAMQKGAYDYIYKPFDVQEMLSLVDKALMDGRCMASPVEVNPGAAADAATDALVGSSSQMLEVYKAIGRVSATDATVLVRGESGTGKELAARAIYSHSHRKERPFIVINCVAIPETLLESELFGYEKGTFTGAVHRKVGKIEQARGGTVFLDEIGDMPSSIQAKFLRLLQENSIERLGGKEPIPVDVRIIAATNRDLEAAVAAGTFREDLYYRLRVVTITMPTLRQRKEDLPVLVDYLLKKLSLQLAISNPGITEEGLKKAERYDWPGNIRELQNILKKALIFNRGAPLQPEEITLTQSQGQTEIENRNGTENIRNWVRHKLRTEKNDRFFDVCMDEMAAILVDEALALSGGNRSQAARLLGVSRPTLHAKIDKFGFNSSLKDNDEV